jgi:3,4-dihydroxy 2-butanone 4-phosphate synthase
MTLPSEQCLTFPAEVQLAGLRFAGTLNVKLAEQRIPIHPTIESFDSISIDGWEDEERTYGPAECYPVTVEAVTGEQCDRTHVLIPERTRHGDELLEVIAPVCLRDELAIADGDRVTVYVEGHDAEAVSEGSEQASDFEEALAAFSAGRPVLIYDADNRESEIDMVCSAGAVTQRTVARLRNDAGGLICVTLSHEVAEALDLPFCHNVIDHPATKNSDLEYDNRPSFSLSVNHRDCYTGITDDDRARTITALADVAVAPDPKAFVDEFRIPGHVQLLKAAPDLLGDRHGHTELGIALAQAADLAPAVVVCEMLNDTTGQALSKADAKTYAARYDIPFVDGTMIIDRLIDG